MRFSFPILFDQYKKEPLDVDKIKIDINSRGTKNIISKVMDMNRSKKRFIHVSKSQSCTKA